MKKKNCHHKIEAGFSILELTIAIFFIGVILVAVAANMTKAAKALWEAKTRTYAVNMAQNCIEDFNYANRKYQWNEFYRPTDQTGNFVVDSGLSQRCFMPIKPGGEINYLCCGDCNNGGISENTVCSGEQIDFNNPRVDDKEFVNAVDSIQNASIDADKVWRAERLFYDEATNTIFRFTIRKGLGKVTYNRQVLNRVQGYYEDKEADRETVVVTVDVTWQKYGAGAAGSENKYSVLKQYLQVN